MIAPFGHKHYAIDYRKKIRVVLLRSFLCFDTKGRIFLFFKFMFFLVYSGFEIYQSVHDTDVMIQVINRVLRGCGQRTRDNLRPPTMEWTMPMLHKQRLTAECLRRGVSKR